MQNKGAVPYIDFKNNASGKSKCEVWNKTFHYYNLHREDFMRHYHRRSNVETAFHMNKSKFGGFVRAKLPAAQVNEVLATIVARTISVV